MPVYTHLPLTLPLPPPLPIQALVTPALLSALMAQRNNFHVRVAALVGLRLEWHHLDLIGEEALEWLQAVHHVVLIPMSLGIDVRPPLSKAKS